MSKILSILGISAAIFTLALTTPALAQEAPPPAAQPMAQEAQPAAPATKAHKAHKKGHKHQGRKLKHHKGKSSK